MTGPSAYVHGPTYGSATSAISTTSSQPNGARLSDSRSAYKTATEFDGGAVGAGSENRRTSRINAGR